MNVPTPLRMLRHLCDPHFSAYAKCEFQNPSGSVKDRIADAMIDWGEQRGLLRPGMPLVEATAGNTGLSLTLAARRRGYTMTTVLSSKMSWAKIEALRAAGATVEIIDYTVTTGQLSPFIERARTIASEVGGWFVDQFSNPANPMSHYCSTGPEIWAQTAGTVTMLIGGIGTGGTLCGAGRYLKEKNAAIRVVLADPLGSVLAPIVRGETNVVAGKYAIEGIGGEFVPVNADLGIVDLGITVPDEVSFGYVNRLVNEEGLYAGPSSGCVLAATAEMKRRAVRPEVAVCILADSGRAYSGSGIHTDTVREARAVSLNMGENDVHRRT